MADAVAELEALEQTARSQRLAPMTVPLRAQALADKAILLVRLEEPARAAVAIEEAERIVAGLAPGGMPALLTSLARGLLHVTRAEHEEADRALAAAECPEMPPLSDNLNHVVEYARGLNWLMVGPERAEDALRWLAAATRRKPGDVDASTALGQAYLMLDDAAAALDAFQIARASADARHLPFLLRAEADALRRLGRLESAVRVSRETIALDPDDPRNWLSLGESQLEIGRRDAATIAYRRGWQLHPRPADGVAAQLVIALTKALLDADDNAAALALLDEPRARRLAKGEPRISHNRAVALLKLGRHDDAVDVLLDAGLSDTAAKIKASRGGRDSWIGFWFDRQVSPRRRAVGALLAVFGLLALIPIILDAEQVGGLEWLADGDVRPLVPLLAVGVLFLLPVVTRIKFGALEIEAPAVPAVAAIKLEALGWKSVLRKIDSLPILPPPVTQPLPTAPAADLPLGAAASPTAQTQSSRAAPRLRASQRTPRDDRSQQ